MEFHALCWDQFFLPYILHHSIISSFDINHHLYTNDTQIYMSLSVSNAKQYLEKLQHCLMGASAWRGGGPRVVVSTAAFYAGVRGSVPGLCGLKETKLFLPHPRVKVSIVGSLRDWEVACSASDRQGSNFESCVWRTVSSQSSHHPQEVLLAQFSLYVHKGGLKPDSFHFILRRPGWQGLSWSLILAGQNSDQTLARQILTYFPMLNSRWRHKSFYTSPSWISENIYPKHVGHASIISVTCVEFEKICPLILPSKL